MRLSKFIALSRSCGMDLAYADFSGPACSPNSRKVRRVATLRQELDEEHATATLEEALETSVVLAENGDGCYVGAWTRVGWFMGSQDHSASDAYARTLI